METQRPRSSLFGPILLIGLGVLLLLNNFGFFALNIWEMLARFWPVILIGIGLDILLGRRSGIGGIIALLLLLLLIFGSMPWSSGVLTASGSPQVIDQPLQGARAARIRIAPGVSSLSVGALPGADKLIAGTVTPARNERLAESVGRENDTALYTLSSEGTGISVPFGAWRGESRWDLRVTGAVPLDLSISTGVGEATINLEQMELSQLEIRTGVGATTITLPLRGDFRGEISGGVGKVTVLAPDTLAVRFRASAGLGSVDVSGDFDRNDDEYTSSGFERAEQRVELTVRGGVGEVEIRQIEKR